MGKNSTSSCRDRPSRGELRQGRSRGLRSPLLPPAVKGARVPQLTSSSVPKVWVPAGNGFFCITTSMKIPKGQEHLFWEEARLCSAVPSARTSGHGHTLEHRRLQVNIRTPFFTGRVKSGSFPAETCIVLREYNSCDSRGCSDSWGHHSLSPALDCTVGVLTLQDVFAK